jgi:hypothetical protein
MVPEMWKGVPDDFVMIEDFTLPAQFTWGWRQPLTPERRLAFSVLWSAVFDFAKYRFATGRRRQRLYHEAWEWVASTDRCWEFSFERLCEEFKIEPATARAALLDVSHRHRQVIVIVDDVDSEPIRRQAA